MYRHNKEKKVTVNRTVLARICRPELGCAICRPNKGCNAGRRARSDRHKNHR